MFTFIYLYIYIFIFAYMYACILGYNTFMNLWLWATKRLAYAPRLLHSAIVLDRSPSSQVVKKFESNLAKHNFTPDLAAGRNHREPIFTVAWWEQLGHV